MVQKVEKCKKKKNTTNGHSFVKNMTIKNPKSNVHLQSMASHSGKFEINSIKDVAEVAGTRSESARAIIPSKMAPKKIKRNTYRCLKSASQIWVPQLLKIKPSSWLVRFSRLLQTNSKGHHHQVMVASCVCSRKTPCPMDVNS